MLTKIGSGGALAVLALVTASAAQAVEVKGADAAPVNAVWVDHDVSFTYTGFTSHYSCDGIEDKIRYVFKQLGARPDYKVNATGCVRSSGPELMPRVRIRVALPTPATPEVLAQLEKNRSTQELAARAGGKHAATADAATAQFPATYRVVKIEGTPISDVQDGDCELMEQLTKQVLEPMGVEQAPGSSLNCIPHQVSLNGVNLRLRVLNPVPDATATPAKANALR